MADNTLTPYLALIEGTVDTVTDTDDVFHRFDMDIGRTLADCFFDHILYQHYDRGTVDVLLRGDVFHHVQFLLFGVGRQCLGYFLLTEIFIDGQHDAAGGGYYGLYLEVGDDVDVIDGVVIQGSAMATMRTLKLFSL